MMLMYGSTIFIIQVVAQRLSHPALWHAPWLFPNQHAVMAGLATSGTLTHWFHDHLARDTTFQSLAVEAQTSPPGARNLLCLPYFSGERTPLHDPNAKGAFFGLNLTHQRADLARSVLEGIAMATRQITETFAEAGAAATQVLAVGGGTQNPIWLQATSDITGLPQTVSSITTGAAFGDAFLAALAIGKAKAADIASWNPPSATIIPQRHAVYDQLYPLFRRLYLQTRDIAAELGAIR
jgi:xylulokinase